MGALPTLRAATDPGARAASTTALTGSASSAVTRKSLSPAHNRTMRSSSAGCGAVSEELTGVTYPV